MLPLIYVANFVGLTAALDVTMPGLRLHPSFLNGNAENMDAIFGEIPDMNQGIFRRNSILPRPDAETFDPVNVEVYANIFVSKDSTERLSQGALDNQIKIANYWFNQFNFSFTLMETKWIVDDEWAKASDFFNLLVDNHVGTTATLNLYVVETIGSSKQVGRSTHPTVLDEGSAKMDSAMLALRAIPGAPESAPGYNATKYEGKAFVHVLGRWLGLNYTFSGGCEGNVIGDIPPSLGSEGCPIGLDSCPDKPGLDPIHNFMSYNDESCKHEFTPGQIRHMHETWHQYRGQATEIKRNELPLLSPFLEKPGKLPFYEVDPNNSVAVLTQCVEDRRGVVRETSERRCGTYFYCIFGLYKHDKQSAGDWKTDVECLQARVLPDDIVEEIEMAKKGPNSASSS
ncbi:hypothetical protein XA68_13268 [Ophiocordyceps unilateralis]|uniref:Peptidase M43 pregnancy-associated plasma-A domain-containing protein n=1 Tax=Ophiocordyceps unilateralis TaxID=268505 RepID=A0A2A9PMD9_OPHUN|nr:hypothetical protein XA68_13268 [Ophiocordyceps unilateralis]